MGKMLERGTEAKASQPVAVDGSETGAASIQDNLLKRFGPVLS
jgi:hypothetical protein